MLRAPEPGQVAASIEPPSQAERRHLTLMFCDLVGSTALTSQFDPEDMSHLLQAFHSCVAVVVQRAGGFIARYTGDGVLVYFGWPRASEADGERAVRAGLAIVEAVNKIPAGRECLHVRIGLATGLVVVGDLLGQGAVREHTVVGEAPNLAARLQTLAEPDTIVIDQATKTRIGGLFDCRNLGAQTFKGFAEPVQVWRVVGTSAIQSRFEALRTSRLTPFINRETEIELLLRRWVEMKQSGGHLVLLTGEAGIGKSRLIEAFQNQLRGEDFTCLRFFCAPHQQDDALHPVTANLEQAAGFRREDPAQEKARKLQALGASTGAPKEDMALFSQLLSVPLDGLPALDLTPQRRKERTFEALNSQMRRIAHGRPLLVVIEDVHWSDPTSLELFDFTIDRLRHVPVLMIMTFRSDWRPPWIDRPDVSLITLGRLARTQSAAMIKQLVTGDAFMGEMIDRIVSETDGVPLFIEELTKAVLEGIAHRGVEGADSTAPFVVPATLHASLMARLDRLPAGKEVAQIGSIIGRGFTHALLADVAQLPEPLLRQGLEQLVGAELLFRRGTPPDADYAFKHALVQDAAYQSLLRANRSALHARVVDVLLKTVPDIQETAPGLLGHHSVQAGLIELAALCFRRAGEQSAERAALAETRSYLERGLALVRSLSDSAARHVLEVELKLALGRVLLSMKGSADAEGGKAFEEAVELCRRRDHPELLTRALWGYWFNRAHRQEPANDEGSAQQLLDLGRRQNYVPAQIVGRAMLGVTRLWQGHFEDARSNLDESLELGKSNTHGALDLAIVSNHLDVHVRMQLSLTLACLGHIEQAATEATRGVRNVLAAAHLPLRAIVLGVKCRHDWFVRDHSALRDSAGALVSLSEDQGFPFYLAVGRCHLGWLAVKDQRVEDGINLMQSGLSALRSAEATIWEPYFLGMIGEAQAGAGNPEDADQMLDRALAASAQTGGVWFDAELHRLKGQVELMRPARDHRSAESAFRLAIRVAQDQSARLWELRATTDLAKLWTSQGKRNEARNLLTPVHDGFIEGHETDDWRVATSLLADLRGDSTAE